MKRCSIAVAVVAAAVTCGLLGSAAGSTHPDCRPPGARTVAFDAELKLYTERGAHSSGDPLYVCRRPAGKRRLVIGGPEATWFKPPAVSLSGLVVGIAAKLSDPTGPTVTSVLIYDFTKRIHYAGGGSGYQTRAVEVGINSDVGSLVVNGSYGVAYIDCTSAGGTFHDSVAPGRQ